MSLDDNWFTEKNEELGIAFSLKLGPQGKLHQEQTEYQYLEVYETATFGKLLVLDHCIMLTQRDNFIYHEMMSQPALFSHPSPEKVLIIGGGDCGTLQQVLKHPQVKQATQIDIDERVTRVSEIYFPELCSENNDPRADIRFEDGIAWVRNAPDNSYDIIIVDSTDPVGPGEVLFTEDFFRECHRALTPNGIFVQQSESPLLHHDTIIRSMAERISKAGFDHRQLLYFPQTVYPSGWWSCTMASKQAFPEISRERIEKSAIITHYYNYNIHKAATAAPSFMHHAK